jgi:hypothetical protein
MRKNSTIFLQILIVILGVFVFAFMLWEPHIEGRNAHATFFEIYFKDAFLAYVYISSISFFTIIYQVFKLLGYIGRNETISTESVKALRIIKYCAIILGSLIVIAALYIRIFHAREDDPAGFIALCIVATFISIVSATAANIFQKRFQKALNNH